MFLRPRVAANGQVLSPQFQRKMDEHGAFTDDLPMTNGDFHLLPVLSLFSMLHKIWFQARKPSKKGQDQMVSCIQDVAL